MTDKHTAVDAARADRVTDLDDWVTGDEPMNCAQRSRLKALCEQAHEPFDDTLTMTQASLRIDAMQGRAPNRTRVDSGGGDAAAHDSPPDASGRAIGKTAPGSEAADSPCVRLHPLATPAPQAAQLRGSRSHLPMLHPGHQPDVM